MILYLELLPKAETHCVSVEDPFRMSLQALIRLFQSAWKVQKPVLFYSRQEKAFLDPGLSLAQSCVADGDSILCICTYEESGMNQTEKRLRENCQ